MPKKRPGKQRIIPDLLNMKYEYLFRTIGREGKYSLELKCLFLVLILYLPGLITTFLTRKWYTYVFDDWRRFAATVFIGLFVWFMIRFLKKIDDKIKHVNQIMSPPERQEGQKGYDEWRDWERKINKYKKWVRRLESHLWLYFYVITWVFGGIIFNIYILNPYEVKWVQGNLFNELCYRSWFIFLGFLIGSCLQFIFGSFWAIRKYCKDVVSHEEILPLDPDHTGGLRELGRLALDLDLIVALPTVAFPLYLLRDPNYFANFKNVEMWVGISILYALLLIFVFFVSISPAHDDMAEAKTKYLLKIHSEYKDMHKRILQKLDTKQRIEPKEYSRLSGLYELYDRVERMAVWPLDFRTTLRFSITSLLPLISVGITIQLGV